MSDLLWSDAEEDFEGFANSPRGAGVIFGKDISKRFNEVNNLLYISRGHQSVLDGYKWNHNKNICTIFSAPNFLYRPNLAAIMELNENLESEFQTFYPAPVPLKKGQTIISKRPPDYFLNV